MGLVFLVSWGWVGGLCGWCCFVREEGGGGVWSWGCVGVGVFSVWGRGRELGVGLSGVGVGWFAMRG